MSSSQQPKAMSKKFNLPGNRRLASTSSSPYGLAYGQSLKQGGRALSPTFGRPVHSYPSLLSASPPRRLGLPARIYGCRRTLEPARSSLHSPCSCCTCCLSLLQPQRALLVQRVSRPPPTLTVEPTFDIPGMRGSAAQGHGRLHRRMAPANVPSTVLVESTRRRHPRHRTSWEHGTPHVRSSLPSAPRGGG